MRVGIVGGGVFGCASAWSLAKRGHDVNLFERATIPAPDAAGTDISKAIRMEYGAASEVYSPLVRDALSRWKQLQEGLANPLLHECGTLFLSPRYESDSFEQQSALALQALGEEPEVVEARDAAKRWPQLSWEGVEVGLFHARGGWLASAHAVDRLATVARAAGAKLYEQAPVTAIEASSSGVELGFEAGPPEAECGTYDFVVACAGAWVGRLVDVPATLTRQQIVHVVGEAGGFLGGPVWAYDIAGAGWYGFPHQQPDLEQPGIVKFARHQKAETVTDPDADRAGDVSFIDEAKRFASERLPGLPGDVESWVPRSCLYTNSPSGDLVIDRCDERVAVAGLGSGHAFKLGPTLGELVADLVEKDEVPDPFRLGAASAPSVV